MLTGYTEAGNYAMDVITRTKDTVSGVAGGLFVGAKDIADQTWKGWENTRDQMEYPEWMQKILRIHEEIGSDRNEEGGSGRGPEPPEEKQNGSCCGRRSCGGVRIR